MVIRLTRDSPLVKLLYRIARDVSLGCHETLVNASARQRKPSEIPMQFPCLEILGSHWVVPSEKESRRNGETRRKNCSAGMSLLNRNLFQIPVELTRRCSASSVLR
jgi:hypothetical protein